MVNSTGEDTLSTSEDVESTNIFQLTSVCINYTRWFYFFCWNVWIWNYYSFIKNRSFRIISIGIGIMFWSHDISTIHLLNNPHSYARMGFQWVSFLGSILVKKHHFSSPIVLDPSSINHSPWNPFARRKQSNNHSCIHYSFYDDIQTSSFLVYSTQQLVIWVLIYTPTPMSHLVCSNRKLFHSFYGCINFAYLVQHLNINLHEQCTTLHLIIPWTVVNVPLASQFYDF